MLWEFSAGDFWDIGNGYFPFSFLSVVPRPKNWA
jgi:hypothetical protein